MIVVENVEPMPELSQEDWNELARACQYAADHVWPHDPRRAKWLRLRNIALESGWIGDMIRLARDLEGTGV